MGQKRTLAKIGKFPAIALLSIITIFLAVKITTKSSTSQINPQENNMLKISFTHDPSTLDPRKGSDPVASLVCFTQFEGLTRMSDVSTREPAAAEKISLSDDKKTYTFHLRDARWSNGDEVIAEDFAYAWRTILDPSFPAPNAHLLYPILNAERVKKGELPIDDLGIKVIDDKTLEITLERPTPYFLDLTAFCVLAPIPSKIAKKNPKWAEGITEDFVTNGPFVMKSWKHANELHFERNPYFWDKDAVKLDKIHATIIDNEITALGLFNSGKLDMMGPFMANIPEDWIPHFKKESKLIFKQLGGTKLVTFNMNKFPFDNIHIRKAFTYAINRQAIIDNLTQLQEQPALGYVPPVMKNNNEVTYFKDCDIEEAKKHLKIGLKELGLKDASELGSIRYDYYNTPLERRIAQVLQQQWKEAIGVTVKLDECDFNIHMEKLNRRKYQIGQI